MTGISLTSTTMRAQRSCTDSINWIDPLRDSRWADFLEHHPDASLFHSTAWLNALRRTYGYRPVVATTCNPRVNLDQGMVFCDVKSWINGNRLVSLPFSDHCHPLVRSSEDLANLLLLLAVQATARNWNYIEIRPLQLPKCQTAGLANLTSPKSVMNGLEGRFFRVDQYDHHRIDLRSDLKILFGNFHRSCIQRKIERARREGLEYETGRSESILKKFYYLVLLTRRRHGLPPQPTEWFRNLIEEFGESLTLRVACKKAQPVAGMLTIRYKKKLIYKYGCSDAQLHRMGAMPMLFWKAIQEEKLRGAEELDLGRSDRNNPGLSTFKEHLGGVRSNLMYFRVGRDLHKILGSFPSAAVHALFARMPSRLSQVAGRIFYRHMA